MLVEAYARDWEDTHQGAVVLLHGFGDRPRWFPDGFWVESCWEEGRNRYFRKNANEKFLVFGLGRCTVHNSAVHITFWWICTDLGSRSLYKVVCFTSKHFSLSAGWQARDRTCWFIAAQLPRGNYKETQKPRLNSNRMFGVPNRSSQQGYCIVWILICNLFCFWDLMNCQQFWF